MYLLDANVLIAANAYFYPLDRIPQFWEWLVEKGNNGDIKMPLEIYNEITGENELTEWTKDRKVRTALLLDEAQPQHLMQQTLDKGYAPDLDETEIENIGRDAFLIAYALADAERVVVTREVSKTTATRGNTKIPDACNRLGVKWTTDYKMYQLLNFNTL